VCVCHTAFHLIRVPTLVYGLALHADCLCEHGVEQPLTVHHQDRGDHVQRLPRKPPCVRLCACVRACACMTTANFLTVRPHTHTHTHTHTWVLARRTASPFSTKMRLPRCSTAASTAMSSSTSTEVKPTARREVCVQRERARVGEDLAGRLTCNSVHFSLLSSDTRSCARYLGRR
jgi:hypothetical protein